MFNFLMNVIKHSTQAGVAKLMLEDDHLVMNILLDSPVGSHHYSHDVREITTCIRPSCLSLDFVSELVLPMR